MDTTATTAPVEGTQLTKEQADAMVAQRLPERDGFKRRIAFLFKQDETMYYRVNFMNNTKIDSFWVEVTPDQLRVIDK